MTVETLVEPLLDLGRSFSVHSVFQRGFNIVDSSGLVLWVGARSRFLPPRSLHVLDLGDLRSIERGDSVSIRREGDGSMTMAIGRSLELRASCSCARVCSDVNRCALRESSSCYIEYLEHAVARHEALRPMPESYGGLSRELQSSLTSCLSALLRESEATARMHLDAMIGKGFGLTPSGDDAVVGALAFCHAFAPDAAERLGCLVRDSASKTNDISRTYLLLAAQGHASNYLLGVLSGFSGEPDGRSVEDLLAYGHSSGQDSLRGVLAAAKVCIDADRRKV